MSMTVHLEEVNLLADSIERLRGCTNLTIQDLIDLLDNKAINLLQSILEYYDSSEVHQPLLAFYQKNKARIFIGESLPINGEFTYNSFLELYLEDVPTLSMPLTFTRTQQIKKSTIK